MSWTRVTKANRCVLCGRPDWCTVGDFFYCCMRVQSPQPCKNGGWLHPIKGERKPLPPPPPRPVINCKELLTGWSRATKDEMLGLLGKNLGMTTQTLRALNCCWATPHHAWAFPMSDAYGNRVGIRLRSESGHKWSVAGSHQGLFIPDGKWDKMLVVTEGCTDCGAALDLGYWSVGRPSCSGGVTDLVNLVKRRGVRRVVIVSDNDTPGISGAKMLQNHLPVTSCIIVLPAKDLRLSVQLGATRDLIDSMINSAIWCAK